MHLTSLPLGPSPGAPESQILSAPTIATIATIWIKPIIMPFSRPELGQVIYIYKLNIIYKNILNSIRLILMY